MAFGIGMIPLVIIEEDPWWYWVRGFQQARVRALVYTAVLIRYGGFNWACS